jgi:hypothetical protein
MFIFQPAKERLRDSITVAIGATVHAQHVII